MCNAQGTLSEACMVYLIDECVLTNLLSVDYSLTLRDVPVALRWLQL